MRKHLYWGDSSFRPGFSLQHTRHVVRHGHFTLKQLRLPVLKEMHTNSCTSPRLFQNDPSSWDLHVNDLLSRASSRMYIMRTCRSYGYSKEQLTGKEVCGPY